MEWCAMARQFALRGVGAFYAPSPILCVAVSWPRIAAGAQSGELYHLEVMM